MKREQEWIQFVPNTESATQGSPLLMLIIIEIFRLISIDADYY